MRLRPAFAYLALAILAATGCGPSHGQCVNAVPQLRTTQNGGTQMHAVCTEYQCDPGYVWRINDCVPEESLDFSR